MPADDRNAMFEKALARQLRGNLRAGADFSNCADSQILAAYHEHTLSAEEMEQCESHISGCLRCQEILSLLDATEQIPLEASAEATEKSARDQARSAIVMAPRKYSAARQLRYWIAPLGAMAAVLVLWVVIQHRKNIDDAKNPGSEIASNRDYAPLQETKPSGKFAEEDKISSASPKANARPRNDVVLENGKPSRNEDTEAAKNLPMDRAKQRAPLAMQRSAPVTNARVGDGVGPGSGGVAGAGGVVDSIPRPPEVAQKSTVTAVTGAAAAIRPESSVAPTPLPPASPAANSAMEAADADRKKDEIGSIGISTQAVEVESRSVADLKMLNNDVARQPILAPGGAVRWRAGAVGRIEKSIDSGGHWKKQKSGVKTDLLAGSAPSSEVCWIAGGSGTMLLTVDGGEHWKKVVSPIAGEIAGVSAVDAKQATVWDTNRSSTFATADGGITWSPVANK